MNVQTLVGKVISINESVKCPISFGGFKEPGTNYNDNYVSNRNELSIFRHHIYEYNKGLRNLVLTTERAQNEPTIRATLEKNEIDYVIHKMNDDKINVYFGAPECVDVVKTLNPMLNKISPSEDFILGIMLGYDRLKQCKRYLLLREKNLVIENKEK